MSNRFVLNPDQTALVNRLYDKFRLAMNQIPGRHDPSGPWLQSIETDVVEEIEQFLLAQNDASSTWRP